MAVLKDDVKLAIVQALACFDTPSQVAEQVKQEFGIVLARQQVAGYDPTKPSGKNLSQKLREVFSRTREAFLADISTIPIAQQAYRLRVLQRNLERADSRGNAAMVSTLLEQAAKELGGAFTNKRELTGKDGQPLAVASTNVHTAVTPEQLKEVVESVQAKF
ncbi:DUF2280 domain-containing protein [Comamonas terrae]|uniref:DUF2280 domain-containing protein n=1 Tax=Comamonas terrae TaxID=673548 RepID=A0ABW5UTN6_9BURK|nr:DUF2280 domain-containing protein [Comamonas terrae]